VIDAPFETRFERLELKYLIDEPTAARVRRALRPYCRPDPYGAAPRGAGTSASRGYPVLSLYLDTPGLAFHRAKQRGDPERRKLRLRRYRGLDGFCLEEKLRSADVVQKTRALATGGPLREACHGLAKLHRETPQSRRFAERFAYLVLSLGAEPTLRVRYEREAYTSEVDAYARLTFDRNVEFQRAAEWDLEGDARGWCDLESFLVGDAPRPLVILEVKCATAIPAWLVDVIRSCDLRRDSVSKYSLGVSLTRRLDGAPSGPERSRGVLR
jgi:hypothetical protein